MSIRVSSTTMIPRCDREISARVSRARQGSGVGRSIRRPRTDGGPLCVRARGSLLGLPKRWEKRWQQPEDAFPPPQQSRGRRYGSGPTGAFAVTWRLRGKNSVRNSYSQDRTTFPLWSTRSAADPASSQKATSVSSFSTEKPAFSGDILSNTATCVSEAHDTVAKNAAKRTDPIT